jgi:hypothetical protein
MARTRVGLWINQPSERELFDFFRLVEKELPELRLGVSPGPAIKPSHMLDFARAMVGLEGYYLWDMSTNRRGSTKKSLRRTSYSAFRRNELRVGGQPVFPENLERYTNPLQEFIGSGVLVAKIRLNDPQMGSRNEFVVTVNGKKIEDDRGYYLVDGLNAKGAKVKRVRL